MRGKLLNLSAQDVVLRALRLCSTGKYSMKPGYNGGSDPEAPDPYHPETGTADCVGVGMYCQGADRYQPVRFSKTYGGWVNTDSAILDARGPRQLFAKVATPQPGDILVYPSYLKLLPYPHKVPGHWMTVVKVPKDWVWGDRFDEITVVHCAAVSPPATRLTMATPAQKRAREAVFLRPLWRT